MTEYPEFNGVYTSQINNTNIKNAYGLGSEPTLTDFWFKETSTHAFAVFFSADYWQVEKRLKVFTDEIWTSSQTIDTPDGFVSGGNPGEGSCPDDPTIDWDHGVTSIVITEYTGAPSQNTFGLPADVVALITSRFGSIANFLRLRNQGQV